MRLIVFDLDGTLFDTRQDIANAVNHARKECSLEELNLATVTSMVGDGIQILTERAFQQTGVPLDTAIGLIMEYYSAHPADDAILYPGVRETLPLIRPTKVIVSNKPEGLVRGLIAQHDLDGFFEFIAGGDTFAEKKPDPVSLHHLKSRFKVRESEILVVGDHRPDILMAHKFGVKSVYCNYGFFGNDEIGADYSIDTFPDLLNVLSRLP